MAKRKSEVRYSEEADCLVFPPPLRSHSPKIPDNQAAVVHRNKNSLDRSKKQLAVLDECLDKMKQNLELSYLEEAPAERARASKPTKPWQAKPSPGTLSFSSATPEAPEIPQVELAAMNRHNATGPASFRSSGNPRRFATSRGTPRPYKSHRRARWHPTPPRNISRSAATLQRILRPFVSLHGVPRSTRPPDGNNRPSKIRQSISRPGTTYEGIPRTKVPLQDAEQSGLPPNDAPRPSNSRHCSSSILPATPPRSGPRHVPRRRSESSRAPLRRPKGLTATPSYPRAHRCSSARPKSSTHRRRQRSRWKAADRGKQPSTAWSCSTVVLHHREPGSVLADAASRRTRLRVVPRRATTHRSVLHKKKQHSLELCTPRISSSF